MARILIVEDEFLIAMVAEDELTESGHDVVGIATTYENALRLAQDFRPDLAVLDVRLASLRDGIDVAIDLRQRFDIPAILATGSHDEEYLRRATPARPLGWLTKPYTPEALLAAVGKALEAAKGSGDRLEPSRGQPHLPDQTLGLP